MMSKFTALIKSFKHVLLNTLGIHELQ